MDTSILVIGIIAFLIGIGLIYWISRRKFYRRNVAGLEGFSSFEASVLVRLVERLGKWIGYLLILIGLLSLWTASRVEKDKKQQEAKTEQGIK